MSTTSNPSSRPGSRAASRAPNHERERSSSTPRSTVSADSLDSNGKPRQLCEQRQSSLHGRGMFTTHKVSKGKLIFTEVPLVHFSAQTIPWPDVWKAYQDLDFPEKHAWLNLTYTDEKPTRLWLAQQANEIHIPDFCGDVLARYWNNSWKDQVFGISFLGNKASLFNHSCRPNAVWVFNDTTEAFEVRAVDEIESGQEVLLNYVPLGWPRAKRRMDLKPFNFECSCSLCVEPDSLAEYNREAIDKVDGQLRSMTFPGDKRVRIELYIEMLHLQQSEPAMVWDALLTATLLQQLFIEIDDLRRAADCQDAMVKMSAICCGKDFCLNQRWKDLVIHTMMLPRRSWISSLAAVEV